MATATAAPAAAASSERTQPRLKQRYRTEITKAPARVGFVTGKDGKKTRVFKASRYSAKAEKPATAKKSTTKKASTKAADETAPAFA